MYIFHFGRHPKLSYQELSSRYPNIEISLKKNLGFTENEFDPQDIQKHLGGTIMISKHIATISSEENIPKILSEYIENNINTEHKVKIGISSNRKTYSNTGFDIKTLLKEKNISSRIVIGKHNNLNTGHILKEKLLTKGLHI